LVPAIPSNLGGSRHDGFMDDNADRTADAVPATVAKELRLIREGIALVASGGAPRTIVAGLLLSESLIDAAGRMAREAGVTVTPLWHADDSGVDFAIERSPA
jgi:diphthamide synthase (EF-2-diphthine--ammonia ligase)